MASTSRSMRSASRSRYAARSFTEVVAHAGKAASAALTARSASTELARATSANFHVQSSGERSSKVREEAMRSPLMLVVRRDADAVDVDARRTHDWNFGGTRGNAALLG